MVSTVLRRGLNAVLPVTTIVLGGTMLTRPMPNLRLLTSSATGMAHAVIQLSDLPKPSRLLIAPLETHRLFTHYVPEMAVTDNPGMFACYPPSVFSKLHMHDALVETVYNGGGGNEAGAAPANWSYCAYSFAATSDAHTAFLALSQPLKVSVKEHVGSSIRSRSRIGAEMVGLNYDPNPIEAQLQIVVRSGRSVGYLQYRANGYGYTLKQFLHLAAVASSRLPK